MLGGGEAQAHAGQHAEHAGGAEDHAQLAEGGLSQPARGEDLTKAPRTSHDTDLDHLIDIATTTKQPIVIQDDKGKDVGVVNKSTLLKGIQGGKA